MNKPVKIIKRTSIEDKRHHEMLAAIVLPYTADRGGMSINHPDTIKRALETAALLIVQSRQ
jgi:hypothetical protein